jgi:quinol monooxygenase YgiN
MYGTVARLQPKEDHERAVIQMLDEWGREHRPRVDGDVASYLLRSERRPGELLLVAVFPDRDAYQTNAAAPEQDQWYQRLREHLDQDPIWEDGEVIVTAQPGAT